MTKLMIAMVGMAGSITLASTPQTQYVELSNKLATCTSLSQSFKHPFTGEAMKRRIDKKGEYCIYYETMPNGMSMTCKYTESDRKSVASYYRAFASSATSGFNAEVSEQSTKTSYTIDGQPVENPIDAAMKNGTCVIARPD